MPGSKSTILVCCTLHLAAIQQSPGKPLGCQGHNRTRSIPSSSPYLAAPLFCHPRPLHTHGSCNLNKAGPALQKVVFPDLWLQGCVPCFFPSMRVAHLLVPLALDLRVLKNHRNWQVLWRRLAFLCVRPLRASLCPVVRSPIFAYACLALLLHWHDGYQPALLCSNICYTVYIQCVAGNSTGGNATRQRAISCAGCLVPFPTA